MGPDKRAKIEASHVGLHRRVYFVEGWVTRWFERYDNRARDWRFTESFAENESRSRPALRRQRQDHNDGGTLLRNRRRVPSRGQNERRRRSSSDRARNGIPMGSAFKVCPRRISRSILARFPRCERRKSENDFHRGRSRSLGNQGALFRTKLNRRDCRSSE